MDIVRAEKATVLSLATIVWECNEFYVAAAAGREIHFSPLVPVPFVVPPHPSFSSSIATLSANLWRGDDIIRRLNSSSNTGPPFLFQICTKTDFRGTPSYLSSMC